MLLGQGSDSVVRLQAATNRAASKHFDDSRNRGIAGRPMRPSPRYTVDHTRMRTFGESRVSDASATGTCFVNDAQLAPAVPATSSIVVGYQPSVTWMIVFPDTRGASDRRTRPYRS